ncbi:hypothetical protein ACMDB5_00910 [Flavobacterium sp. W1B]|uniref:hypothetical protein n=1 Tax=Flavobacterium sp. W1B TaxID=3394146 RepID=UPI0039BD26D8
MKKILALLAITLFTINVSAQEVKPDTKEKAKKESCCAKKMTADEKAKCKSEGKKCEVATNDKKDKKCCSKKA